MNTFIFCAAKPGSDVVSWHGLSRLDHLAVVGNFKVLRPHHLLHLFLQHKAIVGEVMANKPRVLRGYPFIQHAPARFNVLLQRHVPVIIRLRLAHGAVEAHHREGKVCLRAQVGPCFLRKHPRVIAIQQTTRSNFYDIYCNDQQLFGS